MRFDQFMLICITWFAFFAHCSVEIDRITDLLKLRFKLPDDYINKRVFWMVGWLVVSTIAMCFLTYVILEM